MLNWWLPGCNSDNAKNNTCVSSQIGTIVVCFINKYS